MQKVVRQNRAFSLLETMISLIISCTLIFIGSLNLKEYQSELLLLNTTREVKAAFEQAARICTIQNSPMSISYFEKSSLLTFKGTMKNNYDRTLRINKKIKIHNLTNLQISKNGTISPKIITVSDGNKSRKIKIQMTWGRAIDG
ncbi:pilus assembly FimT family protein [Lactobacillus intestinalis]|uniref:pilus assembly FimT family protein n=1 Tax=Lactobacillus intestinalis TaxID=151781 RepID=UPI001F59A2A4|nr:Prepilin-type cleavage/methylation protein [Lactobacillus intestinalis]